VAKAAEDDLRDRLDVAGAAEGEESADASAPRPLGLQVDTAKAAAPPFGAKVVLARGEDRNLVGVAVLLEEPVEEIELSIGGEGRRRQLWQGAPPMPGAIVLDADDLGPGPSQIPLRVDSSLGRRDYTLFLPVMARLGESAARAPMGRLEGETLSDVLAQFSAMTGLVILAEEPLSAKVSGDIPEGAPDASLNQIALEAGLDVERGDDVVYNLRQQRPAE
jgi:hypothetical protein